MAEFESKVYTLKVRGHPKADRLDLGLIGGFRSVIGKDSFETDDLVAYIPEGAIVPDDVIEELGLTGRLAGSKKNRVKAVKLRSILSQGLIYPATGGRLRDHDVEEGDDVTELLGLVKYEPPIPVSLQGKVYPAHGKTLHYDIENIKKYPDVIEDGTPVSITEKLHGTWCCLGLRADGEHIVTSKGQSAKGLALETGEEHKNVYLDALRAHSTGLTTLYDLIYGLPPLGGDEHIYVLGEIYGKGIQDLHYGMNAPGFRVFDIFIGEPHSGHYIDQPHINWLVAQTGFRAVPALYEGPFSLEVVDSLTEGETTLGGGPHTREGVVIKPQIEQQHDDCGRVIFKSVSEDYLLRKGGTEHN